MISCQWHETLHWSPKKYKLDDVIRLSAKSEQNQTPRINYRVMFYVSEILETILILPFTAFHWIRVLWCAHELLIKTKLFIFLVESLQGFEKNVVCSKNQQFRPFFIYYFTVSTNKVLIANNIRKSFFNGLDTHWYWSNVNVHYKNLSYKRLVFVHFFFLIISRHFTL